MGIKKVRPARKAKELDQISIEITLQGNNLEDGQGIMSVTHALREMEGDEVLDIQKNITPINLSIEKLIESSDQRITKIMSNLISISDDLSLGELQDCII